MPFKELGLRDELVLAVKELGFQRPTPIQQEAIPAILTGKNVIGGAPTGTGKTAAFLLPLLHRMLSQSGREGTRALVLTPTRELAIQILDDFRDFSRHTNLRAEAVYGGVGFEHQTKALLHGTELIVATPGRLLDHMQRGHGRFQHLEALVLDEADRMLDMGFLPDIKRILGRLPADRQTLLFSATLPVELEALAHAGGHDPIKLQVGTRSQVATGIREAVYPVARDKKTALLIALLEKSQGPVLVFGRTRQRCERLYHSLHHRGLKVMRIHSDRSQAQRIQALEGFRSGKARILVATDIAARGLDVAGISHVVNFDVPQTRDEYVHRAGRTARAEAEGDAFTLVAPEEEAILRTIEKELGRTLPRVIQPDFDYGPMAPVLTPPPPKQVIIGTRRYGPRRRR